VKQMTSRERVLAAFQLKQPDQIPFMDDVGLEVREKIMGTTEYSDLEFSRRLGLDAMDLRTLEYWSPLFCNKIVKDGHEFLMDGLIKTENDLEIMVFPDPHDEKLYEPVKKFVEHYGKEDLALYVYMTWGIDCVLHSMGIETFSYALYDNLRLVEKVLDRYIEWNCSIVERLNSVGIDFISTYNNIAYNSGPLVSPQIFRDVFVPKVKQISDSCKIPWVFHSDGNIIPIMDDLLTLGMDCIHPIDPLSMNLKVIKETYGHKVCLWGNVDLTYALTRGTPEDVEEEVLRCIKAAGANGGYILGSANCLPHYVKTENVLAMARGVKKYGKYPLNI